MVGTGRTETARLKWWFDHLYPDAELDCDTTEHLDEVIETDWWLQAMAIAERVSPARNARSSAARCQGQRRFTSPPIGWNGPGTELRDDLIVQLQATLHHLHPEPSIDDRTASALVSVVERSLWLQATREAGLLRPA
jgi:hypothetical protein